MLIMMTIYYNCIKNTIKYMHEHSLSNNLINNKVREQMYLKHLRQVQKINNRQAEMIRKSLQNYRSISEMHKKNKIKTNEFRLKEYQHSIQEKNAKIYNKILGIRSDSAIKSSRGSPSRIKDHTINFSKDLDRDSNSVNSNDNTLLKSSKLQDRNNQQDKQDSKNKSNQSLHYRYRKRQQQHIDGQNAKLMKAIIAQKSTILPYINIRKNSGSQQRGRASKECSKSTQIQQKNSIDNY